VSISNGNRSFKIKTARCLVVQGQKQRMKINKYFFDTRNKNHSPARPSQDLLNLDLFSSSTSSTPISYNLPSPLSPMADIQISLSTTPSSNPSKF
jgi:hypothetical protein